MTARAVEHRDAATHYLTGLDDVDMWDNPGRARVLTQAAIAHALLGLLEIQVTKAGQQ